MKLLSLSLRLFCRSGALALTLWLLVACGGDSSVRYSRDEQINRRVERLLLQMTLEEKVGQMNMVSGDGKTTGPLTADSTKMQQVAEGKIGSMLNIIGADQTRLYQQQALKSRLGIPLIFGLDVIHGFRTVFPIPLAEAASFDLNAIEQSARWAAEECSSSGIMWTFAPMADVCRDPRWGRVMEGAGEDGWYGAQVARARVRGFQGDDLSLPNTVMACAKHFAAYGAAVAGRDYNSVQIDRVTLWNDYMPPYLAAVDAGASTVMCAFNDLNGIPCTGNRPLIDQLLKKHLGFDGIVVSDWGSVGEMVEHRYAVDDHDAAVKGVQAGCDVDMESRCYISSLVEAVEKGVVDERLIDDAVRRVLTKKFELGLFDDPFRYSDREREDSVVLCREIREAALQMARKSIVMLKNQDRTLPLKPDCKVALVGALADSKIDMNGGWAVEGDTSAVVTLRMAFEKSKRNFTYSRGYDLASNRIVDLRQTLNNVRQSDVAVVVIGERYFESGEARSKTDININANQQQLVRQIASCGKPVVLVLMCGRPVIFGRAADSSQAVLLAWWLGTRAGDAVDDILFGSCSPSARLPITFPRNMGQIPIYYNTKSTGRPWSKYLDDNALPAYPFGYGLSYTQFELSQPTVEVLNGLEGDDFRVKVETTLTNVGPSDGVQTVQLYLCDRTASITRPVRELRGMEQVELKSGRSRTINFELTAFDLGFWNQNDTFVFEPGEFDIMVATDPDKPKTTKLTLR